MSAGIGLISKCNFIIVKANKFFSLNINKDLQLMYQQSRSIGCEGIPNIEKSTPLDPGSFWSPKVSTPGEVNLSLTALSSMNSKLDSPDNACLWASSVILNPFIVTGPDSFLSIVNSSPSELVNLP